MADMWTHVADLADHAAREVVTNWRHHGIPVTAIRVEPGSLYDDIRDTTFSVVRVIVKSEPQLAATAVFTLPCSSENMIEKVRHLLDTIDDELVSRGRERMVGAE